jgi:hypothetical protein
MNVFQKIWTLLTAQASPKPETELPMPSAAMQPVAELTPIERLAPKRSAIPPAAVKPALAKAARPEAASLVRTLELLCERPGLTARDLVQELSLSPSYSRRLLKRAKAKMNAEPASRPAVGRTREAAPEPALQLALVGNSKKETATQGLAELQARLEQTEKSLATLCATPIQARGAWNLNRRAEVIRMAGEGAAAADIARSLNIPGGEVEFILKVDRMLQGGK